MNVSCCVKHRPIYLAAKCCFVLVLASLLTGGLLPLAAQAQTPSCLQEIVVQNGESLATIAARMLGTQPNYQEIIDATNAQAEVDSSYTRIDDPDQIIAGWKLCIPDTGTENAASVAVPTSETDMRQRDMSLEYDVEVIEAALAARARADGIHPLSIEYLRRQEYPGSPLRIEQTLPPGSNYSRYLVSYQSEGLKIYAAMTVPTGEKPISGWPVIIFNHGYVLPESYSPTERYIEYVDAFARSGYIVLRPDFRGHANSEGEAYGAYGDPGYTIDALNALASIQQYQDADPNRIGMWGHSMGGYITARAMVVSDEIKAGVIWAGVVAPYEGLLQQWRYPAATDTVHSTIAEGEGRWPRVLISEYGRPNENPAFWNSLSANSFVRDLSGPVQLHHGTGDVDVPVSFSEMYYTDIIAAGKMAEFYVYPGDDHNLSASFDIAMRRSLAFFDAHMKDVLSPLAVSQTSSMVRLAR
jgi:uncharacterized protein